MPSHRCSTCGVSWPTKYGKCPLCERSTDYISNDNPDHDWEDVLKADRVPERPDTQAIKIAHNKCQRYTEAGLDLDRAMVLAGDHDADLPLFERLVDQGCDLTTAYDIVRSR